jgi:hypothetical protein
MTTFCLHPDARERVRLVVEEIERLLGAGKHIVVTVAEEQELLSTRQAAERQGFEKRRERGREMADEFSRSLDALGAPLE